MDFVDFIDKKSQLANNGGFAPIWMPDALFDFQKSLVEWATLKGRAAIFADCGLGKTPTQLVWAENIVRKTNKPVLILTPLAVSFQTVSEAVKFGVEAIRSNDGTMANGSRVVVTNYERLHYFNPQDFSGVVCDESSILKAFDGQTRKQVTEFMRKIQYRLLCTATAAPNDMTELGTSSEALGYLGHTDMLGRFFKNDNGNAVKPFCHTVGDKFNTGPGWRLKGHAEVPFWRWLCSWARAIRRPSDIGGDDSRFELPPLIERESIVSTDKPAPGMLFAVQAKGLAEQRAERKRTIVERCEMCAGLIENHDGQSISWCHLNQEGDLLAKLIPGSVQVSGKDSDDEKEEAFSAFVSGAIQALITKPSIGAWGLNFQNCNHMTTFASHSFEQHYQSVRRCWRFGQKNTVTVDVVTSNGELGVVANLRRKSAMADKLFSNLVAEMNNELSVSNKRDFDASVTVPSWL